ncbi:MAG: hypothetical protein AB7P03_17770 [Kofleriaceae bacterium]
MYRDAATVLDEHDRAVGSILIGETLIAQCERAVARVRELQATAPSSIERWRIVRDLHDDYPEIWRHFDRAQSVLAARGVNTAGYDELRPHVRPRLASSTTTEPDAIDPDALDDARRAMEELKLVVPGADWSGIDERTRGLVHTPKLRRSHRLALTGIFSGIGVAVFVWLYALMPTARPDPAIEMQRELTTIAVQRDLRTIALQAELNARCDLPKAQELIKLLVSDGRYAEGKLFGSDYSQRCGHDMTISKWSKLAMLKWMKSIDKSAETVETAVAPTAAASPPSPKR